MEVRNTIEKRDDNDYTHLTASSQDSMRKSAPERLNQCGF